MRIIAHHSKQRASSCAARVRYFSHKSVYTAIEQRIAVLEQSAIERRALIERLQALPAYSVEQSLAELREIIQQVDQILDRDLGRSVQSLA